MELKLKEAPGSSHMNITEILVWMAELFPSAALTKDK
jgi:hypothetical protein